MVGKNNKFLKENKNNQRFLRFSLRKLSVGVVSVAIAAGFYIGGSQSVLADTPSTVPVVRQNAPNYVSTVNTDNQQSASTSAEQQKTANLLDNKRQSNAAPYAATVNDDDLLKNIKISNPTDPKFVQYQGLVDSYNSYMSYYYGEEKPSQYVFSVISDSRIDTDFIWTVDQDTGEKVSVYFNNWDSGITNYHQFINTDFDDNHNDYRYYYYDYRYSKHGVTLSYDKPEGSSGSISVIDDNYNIWDPDDANLQDVYEINGNTGNSRYSSITILLPEKGQPIIKFLYRNPGTRKLMNLRDPIYYSNGLTGQKFELDIGDSYKQELKDMFAGFKLVGSSKASGTFTQFSQGKTYVKHIASDDSEAIYQQIDAEGTMKVFYREKDGEKQPVLDTHGNPCQLKAGSSVKIDRSSVKIYTGNSSKMAYNPFVAGDHAYELIYEPEDQSANIVYVDKDGNKIKTDTVNGKTTQTVTVDVKSNVPAGWVLEDGQTDASKTITFTGAHTDDITIKIEHGKTSVDHNHPVTPGAKTPSGKEIKGAHESDLNKTITRTINVTTPDGQTTTTKQVAKIFRDATIDDVTGEVTYGSWSEDTWADFTPGPVAGYTASPADVPAVTVDGETTDQTVNISYTANDQTTHINYVDKDGKTIKSDTVHGKTGQTVDTKAKIPAGWVLEDGQTDAPKTITFTGAHTDDITIKIEHGKTSVDHNHPVKPGEKTPSGKEIKGAHESDLNKTITRTINVTTPDGQTTTTKQVAKIFRDATIDDVTGEVTYGSWSEDTWADFTPGPVAGYTASPADVPAVTVDGETTDQTVNISYTANDQTTHINYVDKDGKTIKSDTVHGKTGQTVDTKAKIPAGWVLEDGQTDAPKTITFTGAHTDDITIKIEHGKTSVDHNHPVKPGEKTPSGKEIKGAHESDLNKTITRTINVTTPDGQTTTTKQVAKIFRDATIDDVTGEVTYGSWSEDTWADFTPGPVAGYTASPADVPAVTVDGETTDQTVNISYTANDQTTHINYVDKDGKTIKSDTVHGKTGQTVDTKAKIPAGWVLEDGQTDAPKTITFTGAHTDDITIKIEHGKTSVDHNHPVKPGAKTPSGKEIKGAHESDLNQTITRTIKITEPGQATKTTTQVAHIYRDATVDDVTGDVTYGAWSTDAADWVAVDVPVHAGYTASQADVPAVTVKDGQKDVNIDVTYTPDEQKGQITYVDEKRNQISSTPLTGKTDENIAINPVAPAGWKIIAGQQIPTTVKATAKGIQGPSILVEHDTTTVKPGDLPNPGDKKPGNPDKKPGDGTPKTDITYNDLHKAMTRTINVTDPHTGLKTTKVTLNYERTATIDDVTGKVTYGNWTVAEGSKAGFDGFNVPAVPGYTSEIKSGSAADLKALTPNQDQITNWTDQTVDIDYTANDQSLKITYVDKGGNPVDGGIFNVSGKTDQTVPTKAKIPAGWVLEDGQTDAPKTITFTGTPTADITITVEHGTKRILHDNPVKPGDKTSSGKEIKGAHDEDLNQTITRTIKITEPGQATKTTTQVAHIYRDATVDDVTGEVTYSAWSTDSADWTAVNVPSHAGYTAHQSDGQTGIPVVTVKNGQKDVYIDVTYTPDEQKGQITYVDEKGNRISSTPLTGKTDENIAINPVAPAGWKIIAGQQIPTTVKATAKGIQGPSILVEHDTTTVKPGDLPNPGDKKPGNPDKKPGDGTPKTDITYNDLNKTITRTFIVKAPTGTMTKTQHISYQRTATIDDVTGDVTFSDWNTDGASFKAEVIPAISGYTSHVTEGNYGAYAPSQDQINNWTDPMITVTYTANDQSQVINYVDDHNKTIKTDTVHGKTDETVNVTPSVPDHYELVPGQNIPSEVTLKDKNVPIIVKVQPKVDSITDPAKLNKSISRTITINKPGEKPQVINQHADFTRTGQYNEVTGATVYTDWTLKGNTLEAVDAPAVPGYTPNVAHVDGVENPTADTKLANVVINYSADDQTQKIDYVDPNGKVVKTDTVKGKTDETVNVTPSVPDHYELVPGQNIPSEVTLKDKNTPIIVKVQPKLDPVTDPAKLNKSISRTITINKPGEKPQVINQHADFTRTGQYNEVTGATVYTDWTLKGNTLEAVDAPAVPGYTPNVAHVDGVKNPTANTKLNDVVINYTADDQNQVVNYVDQNGKVVKSDTITGKTTQTVDINVKVPDHYELVPGQNIPSEVTLKDKNTPIIVKVQPKMDSITDPAKLNKSISRTITINKPGEKPQVINQHADFTRTGQYNEVTGATVYTDWTLKGNTLEAVDAPAVPGYTPNVAHVDSIENPTADTKLANVVINYSADDQTQKIDYVDPNGKVVKTDTVKGKTDETVKVTPNVPDHYELVPGQEIPGEVKITDDNPAITVKVTPKLDPVTDPAKLNKSISRTITINKPGEKPQVINQTATFKRTGKTNEVTGITTYTPWVLDQNGLTTVSAPEVPGYTPSQNTVASVDNPTTNTKLTDVTINYTANSQTTHINYVDKDGETVKSDTVSGKTDETVKTNSEVPAGWKITDGQIPETIHFTGEETPDTTITIEHDTTSVDHIKPVKPGDKTPSGKVIDGAHESDLNQTITRTINVTTPDGQTTTTKQVAKIFRDATIDDVTGEVTYGSWSEDTWADFKPGQLAGYTASQADVPAVTVKDGQKDQTVDITYTANEGTVLIKYVDRDGNEIGQQVITGHVGDTIKVTPQFPENWVPVDPDTVPAEVQIKEENGQIIIVVVRHDEKDPVQTKKVTRTIMVTTPDGQTKTIKQVVTISRHGNLDLVTGQITWQPWTTAQWDTFKPATIAGYTPSLAEVPAVTVDGETTDQTVDITYAAVATPAQPEHQAPTASDTPDAQQATNQKADSNAQPAVTVVTSQQTATAQQAESTTNSRRLPQTGNSHDASALAGLGLASLMGLLGLGGKRRKRD